MELPYGTASWVTDRDPPGKDFNSPNDFAEWL